MAFNATAFSAFCCAFITFQVNQCSFHALSSALSAGSKQTSMLACAVLCLPHYGNCRALQVATPCAHVTSGVPRSIVATRRRAHVCFWLQAYRTLSESKCYFVCGQTCHTFRFPHCQKQKLCVTAASQAKLDEARSRLQWQL